MTAPDQIEDDAPAGTAGRVEARLVDALAQLSFVVQLALTEVAGAHDLSLTQLRLIGILEDRIPAMAELAGHLGLDRSSVSGLVDRAAARGLVRREARSDDGRGVQVRITEDGARLARQARSAVTARLSPLADPLTDRERSVLADLITKVAVTA